MPLAIALTAPKRVIIARISRLDSPRAVRATLSCNSSVLHLNILAGRGVRARGPDRSRRRSSDRGMGMAVGDVVGSCCRRGTRGVDISRVTICRHGSVVGPLIWRIEVSKWVHGAIESVVVVAAQRTVRVAGVVTRAVVAGARVGVRVSRGVVYRMCSTSVGHAAHAVAVAGHHAACDAGRICAVCLLTGVGEDASLAVSRCIDVVVARLWVPLHHHVGETQWWTASVCCVETRYWIVVWRREVVLEARIEAR